MIPETPAISDDRVAHATPAGGGEHADERYVFHGWSAQNATAPLTVTAAAGSCFWDEHGRRYLDFSSQMINTNIGHQHPRVVRAIREQAARLCMVAPRFANSTRSAAARLIVERAPDNQHKVFFVNSGAEAVEHAVRIARQHTQRPKILAAYHSYHGATNLALHLSGDPRRWASDTGTASVVHFHPPYLYRSSFGATNETEECERALKHLSDVMMLQGPSTIAAVLLEPIIGAGGVLVPPDGYLRGVRELCDRHGILLIADEVMSGFGRAGRWFAIQRWDVQPDLIVFSKGVNSGYVPLGGVVIAREVCGTFADEPYGGGTTYSGHPLACAAAKATIEAMSEEGIVEAADRIGELCLAPGLRWLMNRHPCVGDVRGVGVFWALELVRDRDSREMLVPYTAEHGSTGPMKIFMAACRARGLWPFVRLNRVHLVPPCTVRAEECEEALTILDEALTDVDRYLDR